MATVPTGGSPEPHGVMALGGATRRESAAGHLSALRGQGWARARKAAKLEEGATGLGTRQGSAVAWLVGSEGPAVGTEAGTMWLVGRPGQGGGSASRPWLLVVSD